MTAPTRMSRARRNVVITVVLGSLATGGVFAAAQATSLNSPETRPSWVQPNGQVIEDLAPTAVPVLGPDGEQLIDSAGKPVTYNLRADLAREREVKTTADGDGVPEPGAGSESVNSSPFPLSATSR